MAMPYASPPRRRYQPVTAYALAEQLKRNGVELTSVEGPWRVAGRTLQRPGRNRLNLIPMITNGRTEVMVDSMQHAADLSGFLNWCGLDQLNPVADLTPPPDEVLRLH
jgi:hypothetical protein